MPYITHSRRDLLRRTIPPQTAGELNYIITTQVLQYLGDDITYGQLNEVLGVLEAVKLELYRREIAPYEDYKANENGDVFPQRGPGNYEQN